MMRTTEKLIPYENVANHDNVNNVGPLREKNAIIGNGRDVTLILRLMPLSDGHSCCH